MSKATRKKTTPETPEQIREEWAEQFKKWIEKIPQQRRSIFAEAIARLCVELIDSAAQSGVRLAPLHLANHGELVCQRLAAMKDNRYLRYVAQRRNTFPILGGLSESDRTQERQLLEALELGKARTVRTKIKTGRGKRVDTGNTVNRLADRLCQRIKDLMLIKWSGLPFGQNPKCLNEILALQPLTKSTAGAWHKVAWTLLMEEHNGHPEKNPMLCEIGAYRLVTGLHKMKASTAILDGNAVRGGIKEKLRKAIERIPAPSDLP